ncbi:hypothetical protein KW795_00150 [Candidatus Microgenomates bacterium]|nr:hypothetical protein [Candidatus Microgenomates bacterium]
MKLNLKNILIYLIAALAIAALCYYLFVLPKLQAGQTEGVPLKSLYGY